VDELEDDLIRLRQLTLADVDEWLAGEDDEQIRGFEFPRPATRADVERAITAWQESWASAGPVRNWGVCLRATGAIAGGVELRVLDDASLNLSYVVFPACRGRGVATRAARLAFGYARRELDASNAVIKVLEGNVASLGVARELGAVEAGRETSEAGGSLIVFRVKL
jgi:RimJ/RimL family protein N-acetyltransferase